MRSFVALTLALAVSSVAAGAQTPPSQPTPTQPAPQQPAPQQPAPQPAQPQGRFFGSDAGIVFNQVKPDRTADFEFGITKIKEALHKSPDPVRKQQAASWKVFKAQEPGPNGAVFYLFVIDPAVKGADYSVGKILSEGLPATEVQDVWKKYSEAFAGGQNLLNLTLVANFGIP